MAGPINYNGYNIAPELLNPELQDQLGTLGLSPADYTPPALEQRAEQRVVNAEQQAAQDILSEARGRVSVPQGFVSPKGGIRTATGEGPEYRQELLNEAGRIRTARDEELVAGDRQEAEKQANLRAQIQQARDLGIDPASIGLDVRQIERQADQPLANTQRQPELQNFSDPEAQQPVARTLPASNQQAQAADLITNPAQAISPGRPANDPFAQALSDYDKRIADYQKKEEDAIKRERDALAPLLEQQTKLIKQIGDGEVKDPWENKNFFQKALAVVATGLGGVSAGITGGPNTARDIIEQDIQNEYKRQEAEIAKNKGNLDSVNNIVSQTRQVFANEKVARLQTFGHLNQLAADKFKIIQAQIEAPAARREAALQEQYLRSKAQENFANAQKAQMEVAEKAMDFQNMQGGIDLETPPRDKEKAARWVQGAGLAPDAAEAKALRSLKSDASTLLQNLNQMIDLREREGYAVPGLEGGVRTEAQGLARAAQLAYKGPGFAQLGVLAGPDLEILEGVIPSQPLGAGFNLQKLETAKKYIIGPKVVEAFKSRGLQVPPDILEQLGGSSGQEVPKANQGQSQFLTSKNFYMQRLQDPNATASQKAEARLAIQEINELMN